MKASRTGGFFLSILFIYFLWLCVCVCKWGVLVARAKGGTLEGVAG